MNLKRYFLYAILILLGCHTYGANFYKSPTQKIPAKCNDYEVLGKNKWGIMVHYFNMDNNEHIIELLDDKMHKKKSQRVWLPEKRSQIEKIYTQQDGLIIFYTIAGAQQYLLKAKFVRDSLFIDSTAGISIDSIPLNNSSNGRAFYIKPSPDLSKWLTFSIHEEDPYTVRCTIFDDSLKSIGKTAFTHSGSVALRSIKINNNGDVAAIVGHSYITSGNTRYSGYTLNAYNIHTHKTYQHYIGEPNYQYDNLICEIGNNSAKVYVAANYSSNVITGDEGILYSVIDINGGFLDLKRNFIQGNFPIKNGEDVSKFNYIPKRINVRTDSGGILLVEKEWKETRRIENIIPTTNAFGFPSNNYRTTYIDVFHIEDIQAVSIQPSGIIDWVATIEKKQNSEGRKNPYASFSLMETKEHLYATYNDMLNGGSNLVACQINPLGITKKISIANAARWVTEPILMRAKQIDYNMLLIPGQDEKHIEWILIVF